MFACTRIIENDIGESKDEMLFVFVPNAQMMISRETQKKDIAPEKHQDPLFRYNQIKRGISEGASEDTDGPDKYHHHRKITTRFVSSTHHTPSLSVKIKK